MAEGFIRVDNMIKIGTMGNKQLRIDLVRTKAVEWHRRTDGIDQACGDGDIAIPKVLGMEIHFGACAPTPGATIFSRSSKAAGIPDRFNPCPVFATECRICFRGFLPTVAKSGIDQRSIGPVFPGRSVERPASPPAVACPD